MRWQPTVVPLSAAALLRMARAGHKGRGREFSQTQEFVAGLYWFTTLPLETRLEIVNDFRACLETQGRTGATSSGPSASSRGGPDEPQERTKRRQGSDRNGFIPSLIILYGKRAAGSGHGEVKPSLGTLSRLRKP